MRQAYEYQYLQVPSVELNAILNKLGADGWALHTCDHYLAQEGDTGMGVWFNVILYRLITDDQPINYGSDRVERPEAIACR